MKKLLFLLACWPMSVSAADLPGIPEFIDEMVAKHQFSRSELVTLFDGAQHRPSIIEAITKPATKKPWPEYRAIFVNPQRLKACVAFQQQYRTELQRAEDKFGVPQEIIVALIGVETLFGKNMGSYRVLDALTTLAFDYPRRAPFFRAELENYLLLLREQQLDWREVKGSYAGAIGYPQFMPSSYRKYAVDFNGNRRVDLRNEVEDAIGSVANYLREYGWQPNEPVAIPARVRGEVPLNMLENKTTQTLVAWAKQDVRSEEAVAFNRSARLVRFALGSEEQFWLGFNNFDVITRYNTSDYYAMAVFQLSEALRAETGRR